MLHAREVPGVQFDTGSLDQEIRSVTSRTDPDTAAKRTNHSDRKLGRAFRGVVNMLEKGISRGITRRFLARGVVAESS